jgi:GNAT superfamily N-acetyltransferase
MCIRTAKNVDVSAILEVAHATPWEKDEYLRRQIGLGHVEILCEGDSVVAFIAWNAEFFSKPFVWLVVVRPDRREQGIAGRLFGAVEARCAGLRLYSSTNRSNVAMHRLFVRRGYRRAGELELDPGDPEAFYCIDL